MLAAAGKLRELQALAADAPALTLSARQICDVELLLNGAFSPLDGFMTAADYDAVCENMRLVSGVIWPIPITLPVTAEFVDSNKLERGARLALADREGVRLAVLTIADLWTPDKEREAKSVYGTLDDSHPAVNALANSSEVYIGGKVEGLEMPRHYTFNDLRHTPAQLRAEFEKRGAGRVIAFQTRNPMHRAHLEITQRALGGGEGGSSGSGGGKDGGGGSGGGKGGAHLLIHPVVGATRATDIDYVTRVKCYQQILPYYAPGQVTLSLLPLAMRMGGPREAVWHAIIRKNYGCDALIVGRDHAGPGVDSKGRPFYEPYAAQELLSEHAAELGMEMTPMEEIVYASERRKYVTKSEIQPTDTVLTVSGTELRTALNEGGEIPGWFSYPEVISELRRVHRPLKERGFTLFFTGLPSAGKSTIANIVCERLAELANRPTTLLDGDLVRQMLSSELGFSKEHRDLNIRRIGYVASEITRHHGIAVCAPIAPYAAVRREVREMVAGNGLFVEIFVDAKLATCEARDRKGLYSKARRGLITGVTGIDDPYEAPKSPEIRLDTDNASASECAEQVIGYLAKAGYL